MMNDNPAPLRWLIEPQSIHEIAGRRVVLECTAEGSPRPAVQWSKSGSSKLSSIKPGSQGPKLLIGTIFWLEFKYQGTKLIFENLSDEDSGEYECIATNNLDPTLRKTITIRVKGENFPAILFI